MLTHQEAIQRLFLPASSRPEMKGRTAIVLAAHGTERSVTLGQVENLIAGAIQELRDFGVKEGDRVVLCSENSPEFSSTILACWAINAMAVLVDFRFPPDEILNVIKTMDTKFLATSKNIYVDFERQKKEFANAGVKVLETSAFAKYKDEAAKTNFDPATLKLDQPAFTIFTSGTTGKPKVAVHNLDTLILNLLELAELTGLEDDMTGVMPLPISHIFGLEVFLASQLLGVKVVLTELDPVGFIKAIAKHKPELIAGLPQFFGAMLSAPKGVLDLSKSKLLLCGGAPLTVSLADKFHECFGKRLNNGYGSTECKIVALNKTGPMSSVGEFVKSAKIDIVNEKDEVVPDGTSGEVRITGPMLMIEYMGKEDETKKVLHNGHYHTGDLGRIEDGNLYVSGRMSEMVVVAGAVVFSGQVEEALRNNKAVREVAVVPLPDKRLGQIIKAVVVLNEEKDAAKLEGPHDQESAGYWELRQQFKDYCKQNLKRHQWPMKWEFLGPHDTLPKTLAGKTDKKSL